jgi:hypothetical protein
MSSEQTTLIAASTAALFALQATMATHGTKANIEDARHEAAEVLEKALKDSENVQEALKRALKLAMHNTGRVPVPLCADFGAIAQDLDYVYASLFSGRLHVDLPSPKDS